MPHYANITIRGAPIIGSAIAYLLCISAIFKYWYRIGTYYKLVGRSDMITGGNSYIINQIFG